MGAVVLQSTKHIKKHKKDTVRQRKGKKLTQVRFGQCHFCGSLGVIADRFHRRGYGKQNYSVNIAFVTPEKG